MGGARLGSTIRVGPKDPEPGETVAGPTMAKSGPTLSHNTGSAAISTVANRHAGVHPVGIAMRQDRNCERTTSSRFRRTSGWPPVALRCTTSASSGWPDSEDRRLLCAPIRREGPRSASRSSVQSVRYSAPISRILVAAPDPSPARRHNPRSWRSEACRIHASNGETPLASASLQVRVPLPALVQLDWSGWQNVVRQSLRHHPALHLQTSLATLIASTSSKAQWCLRTMGQRRLSPAPARHLGDSGPCPPVLSQGSGNDDDSAHDAKEPDASVCPNRT
jgi:hypothetical protein